MKNILIIGQVSDLVEALERRLKNQGYQTKTVSTSAEGLLSVQDQKPDLILLDILTNSLHGVTFLKKLRALEKGQSSSKVIILTDLDYDVLREEVAPYKVSDYLVKEDTSIKEILTKIHFALRK